MKSPERQPNLLQLIQTAFQNKPRFVKDKIKLTKALQQERNQAQKQTQQINLARRKLLVLAGKVIIGTTALGTVAVVVKSAYEQQTQPLPKPKDVSLEDEKIIISELGHTQIPISANERALWDNQDLKPSTQTSFNPDNPADRKSVENRFYKIIAAMERSENPYIKGSITRLIKRSQNQEVQFSFIKSGIPSRKEHMITPFSTGIVEHNNRVAVVIEVSPLQLLRIEAASLAVMLVHEAKHAENILKRQENLPNNLSVAEMIQHEKNLPNDQQFHIQEEADAYAQHSEAYLLMYALGYRDIQFTAETAEYIRAGRNSTSPHWLEFIRRLYVE